MEDGGWRMEDGGLRMEDPSSILHPPPTLHPPASSIQPVVVKLSSWRRLTLFPASLCTLNAVQPIKPLGGDLSCSLLPCTLNTERVTVGSIAAHQAVGVLFPASLALLTPKQVNLSLR